jgi:hypothetical protein
MCVTRNAVEQNRYDDVFAAVECCAHPYSGRCVWCSATCRNHSTGDGDATLQTFCRGRCRCVARERGIGCCRRRQSVARGNPRRAAQGPTTLTPVARRGHASCFRANCVRIVAANLSAATAINAICRNNRSMIRRAAIPTRSRSRRFRCGATITVVRLLWTLTILQKGASTRSCHRAPPRYLPPRERRPLADREIYGVRAVGRRLSNRTTRLQIASRHANLSLLLAVRIVSGRGLAP